MDFSLNESQLSYLDTVRKFVKNEITPRILDMEKEHVFPWEIINKAWKTGLINLSIPESVRGYEMDLFTSALVVEGLSYGDTGISTSAMCNDLANVVISRHGTDQQKERFLRPFVEKPLLASFCLTEPGAGSDNSLMTSFIAPRDDGSWVLNGSKCFITNASYASQFTVLCKNGKPSSNFMACVVVPAESVIAADLPDVGYSTREIQLSTGGRIVIGKPEDKLGQRLSNTASVTFEDVIVEPDQIIGNRRFGFKYIMDVLDFARPMVAAIGLGLAKRALDVTMDYTRQRKQFGQRIGDFQLVQAMLADSQAELLAGWALVRETAQRYDAKPFGVTDPEVSMRASCTKMFTTEMVGRVADRGVQIHGGSGYINEFPVERFYRDVRLLRLYEGTTQIQQLVIGKQLMKAE